MGKFTDILKEIIEPDAVDIKSIQYHDELSPLVWDEDGKMKQNVRKVLLENAKKFIEFSDMENLKFDDVILTGSLANYNYNEMSDFDVHILLDYKQISDNEEFVSDYLKLKKSIWNDNLPIQVKGHDVEMYYQDTQEPHHSTGTFSLAKNKWINKPTKKIIDINTNNIKAKASDFMNAIDDLANNKNKESFLKKYNHVKDKIKKMRQTGLENEGEFSSENLAFKVLRNTGYLEKLWDLKNDYLTTTLSMNENVNTPVNNEGYVNDDEIKSLLLKRVPYFKEYNVWDDKPNELKAQIGKHYSNVVKSTPDASTTIKFDHYNVFSNFSYQMYDMGMDRKRYTFSVRNEIIAMPNDETDELTKVILSHMVQQINNKNSHVDDIIIYTNEEPGLSDKKFDEVINNINKSMYEFEAYTNKSKVPLFNE